MVIRLKKTCFKLALCSMTLATIAAPLLAAERTTPVEVKNTPSVAVTNTPNVAVTGTPNVAVTNIPTVNLSSTINTVKIDPTINAVSAPTQRKQTQLWTSIKMIPPGGYLDSPSISCIGYKEARFVINAFPVTASVTAELWLNLPGIGTNPVGSANFVAASKSISDQANFTAAVGTCMFCVPVMADACFIRIHNDSTNTITISNITNWVYLVN